MGIDALHDDLLELILLHIDEQIHLIHAASTCKRWCRIVADAGFLHRFRSIHGPTVVGSYRDSDEPCSPPDFIPMPSSSAFGDHDFSLDFLPGNDNSSFSWRPMDSRGSLILLERLDGDNPRGELNWHQDMIICEPLTRRYEIIAPLWGSRYGWYRQMEAFLLDGDCAESAGKGISMSNFRILCLVTIGGRYHVAVFSPSSSSWRDIGIDHQLDLNYFMGTAAGSLYWYAGGGMMIAIEMSTAEHSSHLLPSNENWDHHKIYHHLMVTAGHDEKARIVVGGDNGILKVFARLRAGGDGEWALEKSVYLPAAKHILQHDDGWSFYPAPMTMPLSAYRKGTVLIGDRLEDTPVWRLDFERKTVQMESESEFDYRYELPWPPALHSCSGVYQGSAVLCCNGGITEKVSVNSVSSQLLRQKPKNPMVFGLRLFCLLGAVLVVLVIAMVKTMRGSGLRISSLLFS
ncbi:hypothetical protein ACP70R_006643 [Stipagrostis hirtigluma subsp. patula]